MPHVLQIARDAAVAALEAAPALAGRVITRDPYAQAATPVVMVSTACEPTVISLDSPAVLQWNVQVALLFSAKGVGDLAAAIDALAVDAQVALCSIEEIDGKSVDVVPVSFAAPTFSGEGDQPVVQRGVVFEIRSLYTSANAPDTLLD